MFALRVEEQSMGSEMHVKRPADILRDRFSTYVLPGRVTDPRRCIVEAQDAASVGLGGVWVSERYANKEPAVIGGLLAHAAPGMRIGGTFYAHMRHPIVTASVADLMQALTGGLFTLVLARASPAFFNGFGAPSLGFGYLRDSIDIYRRLWRGEQVTYDGPVGSFQNLKLTDRHGGPPPQIVFTAMGPQALKFAGEHCDGVLLHPMLTTQGVARCAATVREAAEQAGRDPASVRIIANVIVAADLPQDEEDAIVAGRAVTYLQSTVIGPMLTAINGWDPAELDKLRAHSTIAEHTGGIVSQAMTRDQLAEAGRSLPDEWLSTGAAAGTAAQCAQRLHEYLEAGADEILLHGSAPGSMGGLTEALRRRLT
jgi:5,10-methylenetetrahydromethanopterin reductase